MNTKAQVEIQFNWIFVLIIGVTILAFIIAFTFRSQDTAETRVSVQLANQYETIFSTTLQQPGTGKSYATPNVELEFTCNTEESIHNYRVNGVVAKQTPYDLIASSEFLQTTNLYTWALEWKAPFPVDTFMYVTSPREEIVFYDPGSLRNVQQVLDVFPQNFTHRVVDGSYTNAPTLASNSQKYVFVIFVDSLQNPTNLPDPAQLMNVQSDRTTILLIDPESSNLFEYGTIVFLSREDYIDYYQGSFSFQQLESQSEKYLGQASFFASFFTKTQERYTCLMDKAFDRMKIITQLIYYQTDLLSPGVNTLCRNLLVGDGSSPTLYGIHYIMQDMNITLDAGYSKSTATSIYGQTSSLTRLHNRIATESFCPLLY